ncbi:MAG: hypothetical protein ACI4PG_03995 [Candidatus Ventricola sp.]
MDKTIFRKTSVDRLRSPEQLNEYIRVASPGVWLILGAIILLLIGVIVWGVFGTIPSSVRTGAQAEGGRAFCYIRAENAAEVQAGMAVSVGGVQGTVTAVSAQPVRLEESPYLLSLSGLAPDEFCYVAEAEVPGLADGMYPAEITVETIHPISFVLQ